MKTAMACLGRRALLRLEDAPSDRFQGQVMWLPFLLLLSAATAGAAEEKTWASSDGKYSMRYVADLPAKAAPGQPLGLILGCHCMGGSTDGMNGTIRNGLKRIGQDSRFLVIGIHSKGAGWEEEYGGDASVIPAFVAWAKTDWPIDPRRVYVYGLSAGGWITIKLLGTYPEVFAGGVTWGASDHLLNAGQAAKGGCPPRR